MELYDTVDSSTPSFLFNAPILGGMVSPGIFTAWFNTGVTLLSLCLLRATRRASCTTG